MRIKNETDFDTAYLRKVITWMRRQFESDWIKEITLKLARADDSWSCSHDALGRVTIRIRQGGADDLGSALADAFGPMTKYAESLCTDRLPALGRVERRAKRIAAKFNGGVGMKLQMTPDTVDMICAKAGVEPENKEADAIGSPEHSSRDQAPDGLDVFAPEKRVPKQREH